MQNGIFDVETCTAKYIAIRDKIEEIKSQHEEQLKPYNEALEKLSGMLLDHLNKTGADSVKTKSGTPYKSLAVSVSVSDKEAFWDWMAKNNDFSYVDLRASKSAIKQYMEDHQVPPPGIGYHVRQELHVRRGTKKS